MGYKFASITKPKLSEPFPDVPKMWVCPITGIEVPKDPAANLKWRAELLAEAEEDEDYQQELFTACGLSILLWVNLFVFTYRKFITEPDGTVRNCTGPEESHLPFVTWKIQDKHILKIEECVNVGKDLLTDKSRDMGATWNHIVVFHHQWLFKQDRSFLEISRNINCVCTLSTTGETGSDPGTLMGKHDYINKWLPEWMKPLYHRTKCHLVNLMTGSRIDGETASPTAGSSDRRNAILLDEMAKMEHGAAIKRSTKDVAPCRLPNSTPDGPGTAYTKWCHSGQIEVFRMLFFEHPEKGANRYVQQNDKTMKWEIRSPWFDIRVTQCSPKELAIEVLADHIGSGDTYFEGHNIEMHRQLHVRSPRTRWTIDFVPGLSTEQVRKIVARSQRQYVRAQRKEAGPLRVWPRLIEGQLDQTKTYVFGIDVSKGQGASNSVVSITCKETREKVAEWADANTPAYDLARVVCALALWVGGARRNGRSVVCWETNGPGWDFGRQFVKVYEYPFFYLDKDVGKLSAKRSRKYGWNSSRDKKKEALGVLRRAYAHGGFINHSDEALTEALTYVWFNNGGIGPAELQKESDAARKIHGDRVIADMLSLLMLGEVRAVKQSEIEARPRSMAARKRAFMRRRKSLRGSFVDRSRFDFRRREFYV